ncbi:hypothetical protein COU54_01625 [Candidatus Pacearchaeota archaeon CG10_big_fil_rev_8_21_14_0_10_31_24]|nr:MAG: hypothetical protein COU54_01625 [Candidatus Pacearchaeota archaeon CG10_big_fil_rev_8_21_14_0_10_31_24]
MLTRLLDTQEIPFDQDPTISNELNIDLKRMDKLSHDDAPEDINAYEVKVRPSNRTFRPGLYRFIFEIQYENIIDNKFKPKGETEFYQTETLPMN